MIVIQGIVMGIIVPSVSTLSDILFGSWKYRNFRPFET